MVSQTAQGARNFQLIWQLAQMFLRRISLERFRYTENNGACFVAVSPSYTMLHSTLDLMVHGVKSKFECNTMFEGGMEIKHAPLFSV